MLRPEVGIPFSLIDAADMFGAFDFIGGSAAGVEKRKPVQR
jgi:hypothetical protein